MHLFKIGFTLFVSLALLTGLIYPFSMLFIGSLFMSKQAQGSFVTHEGKIVGSSLIAQKFQDPKYFWPRPSAIDYNPLPSGGSELSLSSTQLKEVVQKRKEEWLKSNPENKDVPANLLFASGSGIDPHISPKAAFYQMDRVAKARGIDKTILRNIVEDNIENRFFGFLGEKRVNVLLLNMALDKRTNTMAKP